MGLLDIMFGGSSKPEPAPQEKTEPAAVSTANGSDELKSDIAAVIAASIYCSMDTRVAAAPRNGGIAAVRAQFSCSAWALTGRQKVMDSRQFV